MTHAALHLAWCNVLSVVLRGKKTFCGGCCVTWRNFCYFSNFSVLLLGIWDLGDLGSFLTWELIPPMHLIEQAPSADPQAEHTPDYLRPLERPVHIGSSTNTWGPLKPSQMWNFDVVQARLKLNRFCPQLPGKHCSLGQRVSGDS